MNLAFAWRWSLYTCVACVLYWTTVHAGYVIDYIGWLDRVQAGEFKDILHSYDYTAHLQGYAFSMWLTVQLRAISDYAVFVMYALLFGAAGAQLSLFVQKLLTLERSRQASLLGLAAGLLWVSSPVNTEIVVWPVCAHYLVTAISWPLALRKLIDFQRSGDKGALFWVLSLQALTLIFLELAYALPLAILATSAFAKLRYHFGTWRRVAAATTLAFSLVALHVLATKLYYGNWIGHYGEDAALGLPLVEVLANPWRYIARSLLFTRHWAYGWHVWSNSVLAHPLSLLVLYGSAGLGVLGLFLKRNSASNSTWLVLLWVGLAGCGAAAVSQLYFYDLLLVNNDRLSALCGMFVAGLVVTLVAKWPPWLMAVTLLGYSVASVITLQEPLRAWELSRAVADSLRADYQAIAAQTAAPIYLIGYANSAIGAPIYGDFRQNAAALETTSAVLDQRALRAGAVIELAQFNQGALQDSVHAEWADGKLVVSLAGTGSWWWRKGLGLTSFSDSENGFTLTVNEWNWEISWDRPPPSGTRFLYQVGNRLRELPYPATGSPQPRE